MSFKRSSISSVVIMTAPFILGLLGGIVTIAINEQVQLHKTAGIILPYGPLVTVLLGFLLFAPIKAIYIKQGKPITFGSSHMTWKHRLLYRVGYALMILGTLFSLPSIWELLTN